MTQKTKQDKSSDFPKRENKAFTENNADKVIENSTGDSKTLQKPPAVTRLEKFSSYVDILVKVFGLITWPVVILAIVLMFYRPIKQLVELLPDKFAKSSEITVGVVSLKIQEQAKAAGNEELATILEGLSADAIEWILKLGNGSYRVIGSDDGQTGIVRNYYIPLHFSVWKELESRGLLTSTVGLDEYEKFFNSLGPITISGHLPEMPEIPVSKLTKQQEDKLLNNSVELSDTGKTAYNIITKVIADLIGQK